MDAQHSRYAIRDSSGRTPCGSSLTSTNADAIPAEYIRGQRKLLLHPQSASAQGLYAKILAGISQGVLPVSTEPEFLGLVALVHELAHCLQDYATGVGFWDWLMRAQMQSKALELGRNASWGLEYRAPLAELQNDYSTRSFVNTSGWGPYSRRSRLRPFVAASGRDSMMKIRCRLGQVELALVRHRAPRATGFRAAAGLA
jgi:hypothetical protein